ncbi:CapA family protein [Actinacidiphila yeochonensis]|uniref:CapA family protein n=1 Tax=Actinacidiphila yeochonensis TaxID=89050 RepID=UPI000691D308|nr:CapA family protein [Actinacidiphila yeochonensis]
MNEGPRSQRRAARQARARRRRRTAALAAVAVALAGGVLYLVDGRAAVRGRPAEAATHAATPAAPSGRAATASRSARPAGTATLAFAGDVHFTGRTADRLTATPALGPLSSQLAAADFSMVNLESAITTRGTAQAKIYHFRTTPAALTALRDSGVDAVTMANNHAVDYGPVGLADTLAAQQTSPIPVLGIGPDASAAFRPYTTTVNGVRLAVLAASQVEDLTNAKYRAGADTPGIASALDRPALLAAVRSARAHADVVVVYLHWGVEGSSCPVADQTSLATDLATAGATVVVGTHAHVMLGSGMLGSTYVAYGFGNFLWYGTSPYPHSDETGVTTVTVTRAGKVAGAVFTPALVGGDGVPRAQSGDKAAGITSRYDQLRRCADLAPAPAATS